MSTMYARDLHYSDDDNDNLPLMKKSMTTYANNLDCSDNNNDFFQCDANLKEEAKVIAEYMDTKKKAATNNGWRRGNLIICAPLKNKLHQHD